MVYSKCSDGSPYTTTCIKNTMATIRNMAAYSSSDGGELSYRGIYQNQWTMFIIIEHTLGNWGPIIIMPASKL